MDTKVRNTVLVAVVAVLASSAFALGNPASKACIDEGGSSTVRVAQQQTKQVASTTTSTEANEVMEVDASAVQEQQLRRELEALGVWVD